jgi:phytoene dehydrogenase-like protein
MATLSSKYDVAIIGAGHNGLVSACYLSKAGLSVLVLERNAELGGATRSAKAFAGIDARLSVYSYLVSLLPQKIMDDLGIKIELLPRRTASYTPTLQDGIPHELLLGNDGMEANLQAFANLTGSESDYRGYMELQAMQERLASVIWPSLTDPLVS